MLEKIKKESIPEKIFELLKREILNGTYKLGDKLPTEMELCKIFGVSRVSVKTALQKLCVIGITEARAGDGTYVKNLDPSAFISEVQEFLALDISDDELRYYRSRYDIFLTLMAMHKITAEELSELEALASEMLTVPIEDERRFNHMDYTFRYKICLASKNKINKSVFTEWERLIYASVGENDRLLQNPGESRAKTHDLHRRIIEVLRTKDLRLCMDIYSDLPPNQ